MNLQTLFRSTVMRYAASLGYQQRLRAKAHKRRIKQGLPCQVHYFHQVDDPYSHLAVQKFDQLNAQYALTFTPHLVTGPSAAFQGSAAHFTHWALQDAASIASAYGTTFPRSALSASSPAQAQVAQANELLAPHLTEATFGSVAKKVGEALWQQEPLFATSSTTSSTTSKNTSDRPAATQAGALAIQSGNTLRQQLGHYQSAMFYFEGEWFWGIDRLRLLEERLLNEGYATPGSSICVPEPAPSDLQGLNTKGILLEYFPSLRSPYTAVGHQRVLDLVARSGVALKVRPVMPMLMRGIPAPRAKQRSIITDSGREGRAHGSPLGRIVDPLGTPVTRAFALFPGADKLGKPMEFVTAYLQAAWVDGVDITKETGLRQVVANAGLDWQALQQATQSTDWGAILEENLSALQRENLWGVPSFRVSGGNTDSAFACWGQDRIWRVENEIAARSQNQ